MKLSVLIPSRGRPFRLGDAIGIMSGLESVRHEVRYVVGCDSDDPETLAACHVLRLGNPRISHRCFVRRASLGSMINQMIEENPADAYVCLPDDVAVLTRNWDEAIADAWLAKPDGVWWWRTLAVRPATYAIVSEKWRRAAGQVWTDYFPYWWDDMWLLQVWLMASNGPMLSIAAVLDDQAQNTQRMRDLRFWSDFYTAMKDKRREQARKIASALGWPAASPDDTICDVSIPFLKMADKIEANQGEKGPVTIEYLRAKKRATEMMAA